MMSASRKHHRDRTVCGARFKCKDVSLLNASTAIHYSNCIHVHVCVYYTSYTKNYTCTCRLSVATIVEFSMNVCI